MTETRQAPGGTVADIKWDSMIPVFRSTLTEGKKPARPSDGAIAQAQRSWDGEDHDGEKWHVLSHRFPSEEMAALAADELKRAGYYTEPNTTVKVVIDKTDKRIVSWHAQARRGRKAGAKTPDAATA